MHRLSHTIALVFLGMMCAALLDGCGRAQPELTLKIYVDGSDVIKLSGQKIWIEHEKFSLPEHITINDQAWKPVWTNDVSAPYEILQPAFNPVNLQKIKISKKIGRGNVALTQMPSPENDQTLGIRIDDNDFSGGDAYEIQVWW